MKKFVFALLLFWVCLPTTSHAFTYDEPWFDEVVAQAESFVMARVQTSDPAKGVYIQVVKTLAGKPLSGYQRIEHFNMIRMTSSSAGHGSEFHFEDWDTCYFFLTSYKGGLAIATPSTGFTYVEGGLAYATYRHSYHQALVPLDLYEETMTAIFNHYHGKPADKDFKRDFFTRYLKMKPASYELPAQRNTFFAQHVAMECIFHLNLPGYQDLLLPFLRDEANFHNQASAARALRAYNNKACHAALMAILKDPEMAPFVQLMCVRTLEKHKPVALKPELQALIPKASTEEIVFGGNIMDPRVGTYMPNIKDALTKLVSQL